MSAAVTEPGPRAMARKARLCGLYAVTPDEPDTARLLALAEAAMAGGANAIQYRNKTAPAQVRRAQAAQLARVCLVRGVPLIVNDDPYLAREVDAAGVHLGADDGNLEAARAIVGEDRMIGASCYDDLGRAKHAVAQGADYVAFGSFFPSQVKPGARRAAVALLAQAKFLGVPLVAIGGITAANAGLLAAAGADAVAVISAVFAHDDPAEVTRASAAIAALFDSTK